QRLVLGVQVLSAEPLGQRHDGVVGGLGGGGDRGFAVLLPGHRRSSFLGHLILSGTGHAGRVPSLVEYQNGIRRGIPPVRSFHPPQPLRGSTAAEICGTPCASRYASQKHLPPCPPDRPSRV